MSSTSDTESNSSEVPHRTESSFQTAQHEHDDTATGTHPSNVTPYLAGQDRPWVHRELVNYSASPSSSSSTTALRALPLNQTESTRYGAVPFPTSDMSAEARRNNIMAMDRKRRLTGSTHDGSGRRRTVASGYTEREDIPYGRVSDNFSSSSRSPAAHQRHRYGSGSNAEIIDLTSSPPPQPATSAPNLARRSSGSASGVYIVPRWQPDSEVSECPICRRPFTFLFRRHHCRKCGRVVCNDCSPHRITIPRQFIVNPPGPSVVLSSGGRDTVDLTGDDEDDEEHPNFSNASLPYRHVNNVGIGGGEKVRLCNPCVPDPQPEPQPNYGSNVSPQFSTGTGRREDLLTLSDALRSSRHDLHNNEHSTESFPGFVPQHAFPFAIQSSRARPLPLPPRARGDSNLSQPQSNVYPYPPNDHYRQRGHMSFDGPQILHHRHHSSENSRAQQLPPTSRPRIRSMLDDSYLPRMFSGPASRPRLNEEDICPICRRALPPKGHDGDESAREAHIMDCISARDPANQTSSSRGPGAPQSPPRGPMHMLPFVATEKDCVGDDGNVPECSICMVEYDVGDELARLECLCKFHRECISEWFTRKQECPVHKIS